LRRYRASTHDCRVCPQNRAAVRRCKRRLTSTVHEESRDIARGLAGTPGFERSRNKRKKVETLFAHLKTTMRFEWTRLCGFSRAKDEFFLAAIAQNPRRMVRLAPTLEGRAASRQAAAHHLAREPRLPADGPGGLLVNEKRPTDLCDRLHNQRKRCYSTTALRVGVVG
jgi:hypothetical protein